MRNKIQRGSVALLATVAMVTAGATATIAQTDTPPSGDVTTQVVGGRQVTESYPGAAALEYDSDVPLRDDHPDVHTGLAYYKPWIDAVMAGTIRTDRPLTAEMGGPIAHPTITFTTTEKIPLPNRVPVR